ncbi:MAG: hypothetical protein ACRD8Z_07140 [Nitrososphaeraceae archaeon]
MMLISAIISVNISGDTTIPQVTFGPSMEPGFDEFEAFDEE